MNQLCNQDLFEKEQVQNAFVEKLQCIFKKMDIQTAFPAMKEILIDIKSITIDNVIAGKLEKIIQECKDQIKSGKTFYFQESSRNGDLNAISFEIFSQLQSFIKSNDRIKQFITQMFLQLIWNSEMDDTEPAYHRSGNTDDEAAFRYVAGFVFRHLWQLYREKSEHDNFFRSCIIFKEDEVSTDDENEIEDCLENEKCVAELNRGRLTRITDEAYYLSVFARDFLSTGQKNLQEQSQFNEMWNELWGGNSEENEAKVELQHAFHKTLLMYCAKDK